MPVRSRGDCFVPGATSATPWFCVSGRRAGYTSFEVLIGGQYLDEQSQIVVSGEGITAKVLEYDKLPPAQVVDVIIVHRLRE